MNRRWLHWLAVMVAVLMPLQMVIAAPVFGASTIAHASSHCTEGAPTSQPDHQWSMHCAVSCSALPASELTAFEPRQWFLAIPALPMGTAFLAGTELEPVPPPPRVR